jgi:hypothetical protein
MSFQEQVADRIGNWGDKPGERGLWMLRTFIDVPSVQQYVTRFIAEGSVSALASYFFTDTVVAWSLFDPLKFIEPSDVRIAINLALENVGRGASVAALWRTKFSQLLSSEDRSELIHGLASEG